MSCNCDNEKNLSNLNKWKYTIYTSIILFIIFNPYAYKLSNKIFGNIINKNGCTRNIGLIIHIIIFTLVVRYIMDLPI